MPYKLRSGKEVEFDISKKACHPFGFYHGDMIDSRHGRAMVLGVRDNALWFIWDSEPSIALMYEDHYKKEDFIREGFTLVKRAERKR